MKTESGRSLIEIVGVLAVTGVMTASAIGIYNSIRTNQHNTIATAELREVAKNTKLLMEMRGDYSGVSVDYLIKAGALKNEKPPVGTSWDVDVDIDKTAFVIKLYGLSRSECEYFAVAVPAWATDVLVNGYHIDKAPDCFSGSENEIFFKVK
ncbi:MAG: hypothetical protein J5611_03470 [Alphaproteobacteria bacterium]|jgi:hypothetical protein|nr:hypothetical protein [Alphaproteobacteria bacterium]